MARAEVTRRATAEHGLDWAVFHDSAEEREDRWVAALKPAVTPLYLLLDEAGRLERVSMRLATLFE